MMLSVSTPRADFSIRGWLLFATLLTVLVLGAAACGGSESQPPLQGDPYTPPVVVDDSSIHVTADNIDATRQALISYIWGSSGFPSQRMPTSVTKGIAPPVPNLTNLLRVDELRVDMDGGEWTVTDHYIPVHSNGRLVIVAAGHMCTFADADLLNPLSDNGFGESRTIDALLKDGYGVLTTYMPHERPGYCVDVSHNDLVASTPAQGSPIKWFLEHIAVSLNYLKAKSTQDGFPAYRDYNMIGLSGGGWTTVLYSAIDPTVKISVSISGTLPVYLRSGTSSGDAEQMLPSLYQVAGYPDLYVLGSYGPDRRQVGLYIRNDDCCFGQSPTMWDSVAHGPWDQALRHIEAEVNQALVGMATAPGAGFSFRIEIDETPNHHTMSWNTIVGTVLSELNGGAQKVSASSASNVFVRHVSTLRQWSQTGWTDTKLAIVGTPAVLEGALHKSDLFYRSPSNELMHSFSDDGSTWTTEDLQGVLVSDPVAVPFAGGISVAGIGPGYLPVVWWMLPGAATTKDVLDQGVLAAGKPSLVAQGFALELYVRGIDRLGYHLEWTMAHGWTSESVGAPMLDFPTATAVPEDQSQHVFMLDADTYQLREGIHRASDRPGTWAWSTVSQPTASSKPTPALGGTPSVTLDGTTVRVSSRTRGGSLAFYQLENDWSAQLVKSHVSGSPLSVGAQVFVTSDTGEVWRYDGRNAVNLGLPPP